MTQHDPTAPVSSHPAHSDPLAAPHNYNHNRTSLDNPLALLSLAQSVAHQSLMSLLDSSGRLQETDPMTIEKALSSVQRYIALFMSHEDRLRALADDKAFEDLVIETLAGREEWREILDDLLERIDGRRVTPQ